MKLTRTHYLLILLVIIGAAIRLSNLGSESLWLDEAATLMFSSSGYVGVWNYILAGEYNPPLFYWLVTFMLNFGDSEFIIRFVSCVAGIATIPAVYLVGKEWQNEYVGLAGAALLAFAPYHVYFSQEARAYALVTLFAVLMIWAYMKAVKTNSYWWWMATAGFAALAFWTHFYVCLLIAMMFLHALWISYKTSEMFKRVLLSGIAFLWFTLPLLLVTYNLFKLRTASMPTFGLSGMTVLTDLFWSFGLFMKTSAALFFVLFVIGLFLTYRKDNFMMLVIFGGCLAITVPFSYKIPMVARYLMFLLPLYLLIISVPIIHYLKNDKLRVLAVCALIAFGTAPLYQMQTQFVKDDWRGFGSFLESRTNDGDTVITVPGYMHLPLNIYYNNSTDNTIQLRADSIQDILNQTVPGRTWIVMTPDVGAVVTARPVPQWLNENSVFVSQWEHYLYLYHR